MRFFPAGYPPQPRGIKAGNVAGSKSAENPNHGETGCGRRAIPSIRVMISPFFLFIYLYLPLSTFIHLD
jgi:hypothetical protein